MKKRWCVSVSKSAEFKGSILNGPGRSELSRLPGLEQSQLQGLPLAES